MAQPFGTPEAESKAVREGAAALAAIERASPEIITPEAKHALEELQLAAVTEPAADGEKAAHPIARRSWLRAVRNVLSVLSADALASSRDGLRLGIMTIAAAIIRLAQPFENFIHLMAQGAIPCVVR